MMSSETTACPLKVRALTQPEAAVRLTGAPWLDPPGAIRVRINGYLASPLTIYYIN
jgi:hypothetical protein